MTDAPPNFTFNCHFAFMFILIIGVLLFCIWYVAPYFNEINNGELVIINKTAQPITHETENISCPFDNYGHYVEFKIMGLSQPPSLGLVPLPNTLITITPQEQISFRSLLSLFGVQQELPDLNKENISIITDENGIANTNLYETIEYYVILNNPKLGRESLFIIPSGSSYQIIMGVWS